MGLEKCSWEALDNTSITLVKLNSQPGNRCPSTLLPVKRTTLKKGCRMSIEVRGKSP